MMIKSKYRRAYLREWCRRRNVQYNRSTWLVKRHSALEENRRKLASILRDIPVLITTGIFTTGRRRG